MSVVKGFCALLRAESFEAHATASEDDAVVADASL
jgi:hypothetical protein